MTGPRLIRVWADIRRDGKCRACKQPFVFRISFTSGHYLPFDVNAVSLGVSRDAARGLRFETLSSEHLHLVTCPRRQRRAASEASQ